MGIGGPLLTGGLTRRGSRREGALPLLVGPWFPWPQLFRRGPTASTAFPGGPGRGLVAAWADLRLWGGGAATRVTTPTGMIATATHPLIKA